MRKTIINKILLLIFISNISFADDPNSSAKKILSGRYDFQDLIDTTSYYLNSDSPFLSVPLIKELLVLRKEHRKLSELIDEKLKIEYLYLLESLPIKALINTGSKKINYVLAKKLFNKGKFKASRSILMDIKGNDDLVARSLMMIATMEMLRGDAEKSIELFDLCASYSSRDKLTEEKVSDYCKLGKARTLFNERSFVEAEDVYLDIQKTSALWPDVLFEEAWNSYYLEKYNRTLGKLVTYNAPFLQQYLNPEIEVLEALTYLRMCLYEDSTDEVNGFYRQYQKPVNRLKSFIRKNRSKNFYGRLFLKELNSKSFGEGLLSRILYMVNRSNHVHALVDLYQQIESEKVIDEKYRYLASLSQRNSGLIKERIVRVLGELVYEHIKLTLSDFNSAFKGMSFIKLEALKRKKEMLYSGSSKKEKRGDLKYLDRTDKQYFWNFNGEFWADELGDYVFALKSEC